MDMALGLKSKCSPPSGPLPHRAVVVDDDPGVLELIATALRRHGFEVEAVASGHDGIRAVTEWLPNVVISDVIMPGMSGDKVAQTLKSQPVTAHIPILLVSGSCDSDAMRAGDAFLAKPFTVAQLTSAVERLAGAKQSS